MNIEMQFDGSNSSHGVCVSTKTKSISRSTTTTPTYPESNPTVSPIARTIETGTRPMMRLTRDEYIRRLKMSRPSVSVPKTYEGSVNLLPKYLVQIGSSRPLV